MFFWKSHQKLAFSWSDDFYSNFTLLVVEYFLEDCIQMTKFIPPPKDKKKKDKDEEGTEDDDVSMLLRIFSRNKITILLLKARIIMTKHAWWYIFYNGMCLCIVLWALLCLVMLSNIKYILFLFENRTLYIELIWNLRW